MRFYLPIFFLVLGACFGMQALALRAAGGKTAKSESNFFSSVARIQSGTRDQPDIMLLGSSITGRLPDRANGFTGFANLGCDGGSAVDALRAMDQGILPVAPLLVIEANTLGLAMDPKETEISQAMRSPWFQAGRKFSGISATARPAAFFYSRLLARKIGTAGSPDGERVAVSTTPVLVPPPSVKMDGEREQKLIREVAAIIGRLEKRGAACRIVIMPPGVDAGGFQDQLAQSIAAEAQVPLWDLGKGIPKDKIQLTDGVHMASESAALTVRTLAVEFRKTGGFRK